jgi:hypothetical protein
MYEIVQADIEEYGAYMPDLAPQISMLISLLRCTVQSKRPLR